MQESDLIPVVVTTAHKGVFFGYINPDHKLNPNIELTKVRMCVSWSGDLKGMPGLAAIGPTEGCRIGLEVPSVALRDVTAVFDCTEKAVAAWGIAPWA